MRGSAASVEPDPDSSAIREQAKELRDLLDKNFEDFRLSGGKRQRESVLAEINRIRVDVEDWAHDHEFPLKRPDVPYDALSAKGWAFSEYSGWLNQIIGHMYALRNARRRGQMSSFAKEDPEIEEHLRAERYGDAVFAAARLLETEMRTLTGLRGQGRKLAGDAIRQEAIRVECGGSEDDEENYQEGVRILAMGAFAAFRNPTAHDERPPLAPEDAANQVSIFMYVRALLRNGGSFGNNGGAPEVTESGSVDD